LLPTYRFKNRNIYPQLSKRNDYPQYVEAGRIMLFVLRVIKISVFYCHLPFMAGQPEKWNFVSGMAEA